MAYCENLFAEDFGGRRTDGSSAPTDKDGGAVSSHFFGQSAFGTYANVVESSVIPVAADAPLELLAPLGGGMQTGAGSVLNELRPPAGSSLAVTGAGAVGLAAVMAAVASGCTTIIAVDVHDNRLKLAKELGATHVVNSRNGDPTEQLLEATGGGGVDYVLDTTAIPAVLQGAEGALGIRGTLAFVGAAAPGTTVSFEIGASLVRAGPSRPSSRAARSRRCSSRAWWSCTGRAASRSTS